MLRHSFGGTVIFFSLQHFIFYGKDLFVLISVVCFDQLSGDALTQKLFKILYIEGLAILRC